jgi:hypothetical protein
MEMNMEQAKAAYQSLSEQERELIREAMDSPLAGVLAKIFPDLIGVCLAALTSPGARWTQPSARWQQGC